ncbi:adenylyltransferase and sulfurtransferase MOCS3 [Bos taurus]|uniref:Isoform 2 of Adenylyltransferase and sulfurtransferase MOCS3 n=1 Tax=Bos taurus TaxID=9913 RepID=A1A4L8-2|nr:adenylyltransferase and sulfurtransferase MOCS3 [Bos taurus]AAI26710.1 Molybdenum cofactor synthesis 3 [Bos taurus]DAA23287.1 TPA: adenylyltransferase and sulfurtransferase MOCS3 [Bos taurus]
MAAREEVLALQAEVAQREEELSSLKQRLAAALSTGQESARSVPVSPLPPRAALSREEIRRYSRQLVLPELGMQGQLRLAAAAVLVVGCGGLGCPLAQYLTPATALDLVRRYDVVADCSDNAPTRYLVSDACVLAGRPLVSASALRFEGQLTVYHYGGGPCYRCVFPRPPPAETVTSCADGGVLGAVTGVLGCLQALEVLKTAAGLGPSYSGRLLLFDALRGDFRCIRLRRRRPDCAACGERPTVTDLQDYESFCGSSATDKCRSLRLLSPEERISIMDYKRLLDSRSPHLLLDVRPQVEVDICRLPHALHIPLKSLERRDAESLKVLGEAIREGKQGAQEGASVPIYVICKLGNDSQKAVKILQSWADLDSLTVKDVVGGLMAWAAKIDGTFPQY